ncbi:ABC transporter substrate-binding protein [Rhodoferax ferrireducens]|uniref:ABC transporter substrate-binding protein n=1 Tax=Rhodoferax ferrireducens TaxID=192843 RepID=UPI000E0DE1E3|nr:ABC transporter substrate-binding protein [Rhodoferax ferrireducens]
MSVTRLLSLLFICGAVHAAPPPVSVSDLVIGQVAPLSGVLAKTGKQMVAGGQIYFDHINAQGGINGRKIRVLIKDDGYKVDETVRLTRELIESDKALALFGFAGTGNIAELLKLSVLKEANIPLVAPYTGGEPLRSPFNPYIFHVRAGYGDEAEAMVNQLATIGIKNIAVFYQNDPFGLAGLAGVEAAAARHGAQIVSKASYEKNTENVEQAVNAIAKAGPQAVIMISITKSTAAFIQRFRKLNESALLFSISVVNVNDLVELVGTTSLRGIGITQVAPSPTSGVLATAREYRTLLKKYAPQEEPSYTSFEEFLGAKVLVEGLRCSGANPTRQKLMEALASIKNFDLGGHDITFGENNRIGSKFVEVTMINGAGKLKK